MEKKSTHRVEVVLVSLEPHPNADNLSIVRLFGGGYQAIVRTEEWGDGDLGAYVPPDSMVPTDRPEFEFLAKDGKTHVRVKAKRLRKVWSMGLLVKAPAGAKAGDDVAERLGVKHYEPPQKGQHRNMYGSAAEAAPECKPPVYDVDSLRRYGSVFRHGEPVLVTEKIHGANARYMCEDRGWFEYSFRRGNLSVRFGTRVLTWSKRKGLKVQRVPEMVRYMRVGSHRQWKRYDPRDQWWRALEATPELAEFCRNNPDLVVYGEIYGDVQDLTYGCKPGEIRFVAFDLLRIGDDGTKRWLDADHCRRKLKDWSVPQVPMVYSWLPFDFLKVLDLAEMNSILAYHNSGGKQMAEGIVVKPITERYDPLIGRVNLKVVSNGYLERAK